MKLSVPVPVSAGATGVVDPWDLRVSWGGSCLCGYWYDHDHDHDYDYDYVHDVRGRLGRFGR